MEKIYIFNMINIFMLSYSFIAKNQQQRENYSLSFIKNSGR